MSYSRASEPARGISKGSGRVRAIRDAAHLRMRAGGSVCSPSPSFGAVLVEATKTKVMHFGATVQSPCPVDVK